MMSLDQIREALRDRRLDIVSRETGLHRNTLSAIRSGKNENPKYIVIKALSDYFCANKEGG